MAPACGSVVRACRGGVGDSVAEIHRAAYHCCHGSKGHAARVATPRPSGLHGLELRDISIGEPPLTLATLTLDYDLRALLRGQMEDVALRGLKLQATQQDARWQLDGLDGRIGSPAAAQLPSIPVTLEELAVWPFAQLQLTETSLRVAGGAWQATLPVAGMFKRGDTPSLTITSDAPEITLGNDRVTARTMNLAIMLDETIKQWNGTFEVKSIAVESESMAAPPLNLSGTLAIHADSLAWKGALSSDDASYDAAFQVTYSLSHPEQSQITIDHARIPLSGWHGVASGANYSVQ